jgi:hypothetical protein
MEEQWVCLRIINKNKRYLGQITQIEKKHSKPKITATPHKPTYTNLNGSKHQNFYSFDRTNSLPICGN